AVVLDKNGKVVGEGCHERAGKPHAEVIALDKAGEAARGGTLYVNLEPCCHTGRTPPCVNRVLASGVGCVVVGMKDPNPVVDGGGIVALREKGVKVVEDVLSDECEWLNRAFVKRVTHGLPWLCLKLATTVDGKIADRNGSSRWISGEEARQYVHELRNVYDVVLIGANTALRDDPQLNVRGVENKRDPLRAVIDAELRLDPEARLLRQDTGGRTVIFARESSVALKKARYPEHITLVGLQPLSSSPDSPTALSDLTSRDDILDLAQGLRWLAEEGHNSVLCEGGGRLAGLLLRLGLVDELNWIIAPKVLLDKDAVPAVFLDAENLLPQALQLKSMKVEQLGCDILIKARV
ncbi:MAG TPA: bifunctional diaminohydroxyphosphoribosylaminopyrimidine deaminase/5-amino-6-(5-phosphoribosylamino)uracil reductase RibD, partial [Candidatus Obscuribacterales bacterium]